jgi:hypothetical protein
MTKPNYSHITVLLDRSGSMNAIKSDMEGGLATFIAEQKLVPGEATFSLCQFDDRYEQVLWFTPLDMVEKVTLEPRGMTALLDAMVRSITETGARLAAMAEDERPEHVLFVVITDGLENASTISTRDQVKDLVERQTNTYGWTFQYLGANQDAVMVGQSMGFTNTANYAANAQSVNASYAGLSASATLLRSTGTYTGVADTN